MRHKKKQKAKKKFKGKKKNFSKLVLTLLGIIIGSLLTILGNFLIVTYNESKNPNYFSCKQYADWNRKSAALVVHPKKFFFMPWQHDTISISQFEIEFGKEILGHISKLRGKKFDYRICLADEDTIKNRYVNIIIPPDSIIAQIWFGYNEWIEGNDGLIRIVTPNHYNRKLWSTFRRFTDGKYVLERDTSVPDAHKDNNFDH